ncbi:MAG: hypothetical protein ACYSUC_04905 [Planctomycetota bacterium]|jgi:hypothetical protein
MNKKNGNFFEQHVEKLVLAIVGVVLIWLAATRVLVSPNKVSYGNNDLGPGRIARRIAEEAETLAIRLKRPAEPLPEYIVKAHVLIDTLNSPLSGVDTTVTFEQPFHVPQKLSDRKYRIPPIGGVSEVALRHFRTVVYWPTTAIDERNGYDEAGSEPNDIDFVTVEAKFNVVELYENFYETFMGGDLLREEWRDPCLAQPVFAAVQLQRQQLLAGGRWSDWQDVPRTRVDHRRETFALGQVETLPPGGIKVRLVQFNKRPVVRDLLQPETFRIASAEEEWFPPSVHDKYLDYRKKQEAEERRKELEEKKKEVERDRERGRYGGPEFGHYMDRGRTAYEGSSARDRELPTVERGTRRYDSRMPPPRRPPRRREERLPKGKESSETASGTDFYGDLDKILITDETDLSKMTEPLVFWAHDDSLEPGNTYRYRIRLGVFNPVAGTDQISPQDKSKKSDVILWSSFSRTTQTVNIPERLYFFPLDVREGAKSVTVQVFKYVSGYWRGNPFRVQQGEVVGRVVENKKVEDEATAVTAEVAEPEAIDYGTGVVLVDVRTVNGWSRGGNTLLPQYCSDMLYSLDGTTIEHMPIGQRYWPKELHARYLEVKKLAEKPHKPLRSWGSKTTRRREYARERTREESSERDSEDSRRASEEESYRRMMEKRGMKF